MDKENRLCQVSSMISYFLQEKSGQGQEPLLMKKKIRKLFFTALVFHFAWSEFTSIFQSLWVCSTISHCSQLHGNLGDSWSYPFVAYIVVIRRKFPNESSYHNTKQTALTLVIYKICPSLYYNFQLKRTNLAVIEVNEQRCIHIFFFLELKKCN